MADKTYLQWPFFEQRHRELSKALEEWAAKHLHELDHGDTDELCKTLVTMLGQGGWCQHTETLARHEGLADFSFAMQGLGTGAISLFGTNEQKTQWLPATRDGKAIAAFALTEPQSGSDVANSTMSATPDGNDYVLNGEKTWISNGGIADMYTVFARTNDAPGAKGLSAFIVPADIAARDC